MVSRSSPLRYSVKGVVDMGTHVQLQIGEDVETERIDPAEQVIDSMQKSTEMPEDTKRIMIPYMKTVLKAIPLSSGTPTRIMANQITINVPRRLYEQINRPNIGDILVMELRKESTGDHSPS